MADWNVECLHEWEVIRDSDGQVEQITSTTAPTTYSDGSAARSIRPGVAHVVTADTKLTACPNRHTAIKVNPLLRLD